MSNIHPEVLHPLDGTENAPEEFTFPHCYVPHPLVVKAAEKVKQELRLHIEWKDEIAQGKMFGVLIVEGGFLAAFSGTLGGKTIQPYFVEPVYDLMSQDSYFKKEEHRISELNKAGEDTREQSITLQRWLFAQYQFLNYKNEEATIDRLFDGTTPPSGTGDCCAPKLLQAAYRRGLKPLCMGEFWMGASPKGEIRKEGLFYPACSAKCKPLLRHMLKGLNVEVNPLLQTISEPLRYIYEDQDLAVVLKPSGMLAVPGKDALPNVQEIVRERFTEATGPLIVHRLDMDTSGLMIIALNEESYHHLQNQFVRHEVEKRYTAILEHELPIGEEGRIDLPICPDITDRPRQMVHEKYGKRSITEYRVIDINKGHAVIHLWPHTGRTHQLRVHMAHPLGLNNPIVGDRLYGTPGKRLMLHAAELSFKHPRTGEKMHFLVEAEEN